MLCKSLLQTEKYWFIMVGVQKKAFHIITFARIVMKRIKEHMRYKLSYGLGETKVLMQEVNF